MNLNEHLRFEFDEAKNRANAGKHGLGLAAARELWSDPDWAMLRSSFSREPRYLAIGLIRGKHWTAVFTWRLDRIRIISLRRSRRSEERAYEEEKRTHHGPKSDPPV